LPAVVPATPRRLAFLGTPAVAAGTLRALVDAGFEVAVVVTRADKRRSRGGGAEPSPVKETAIDLGLPVTTKVDDVIDAAVDLGVVVAFGQLVKPHVLDAVPMVNVHFSLLPRWRGAAPVERAILAGDTETGVCLMQLEEGLDTGPVFACEQIAVDDRVTADELRAHLGEIGSRLLVDELRRGLGTPTPQGGDPTYAAKIDSADLEIDWTRPAVEIARLVRAGRAWTTFRGNRLLVVRGVPGAAVPGVPGELRDEVVATGEGSYVLEAVQPQGRSVVDARAWRNGARPAAGERLGS
jgi:methionyl-tRNA formyltransferase